MITVYPLLAILCPPLILSDTNLTCTVTSHKFGGIAQCNCAKGFRLNGASSLHCSSEGTWSSEIPTCESKSDICLVIMLSIVISAISCSTPLTIEHGFMLDSMAQPLSAPNTIYHSGAVVIYGCQSGYLLSGIDFIVCQKSGEWSPVRTECKAYCKYPGDILNGRSTQNPREYYLTGEKLVYVCTRPNFRLQDENVLECLSNGQWSRTLPRCVLKKKASNYLI